jgi:hypothetical protein
MPSAGMRHAMGKYYSAREVAAVLGVEAGAIQGLVTAGRCRADATKTSCSSLGATLWFICNERVKSPRKRPIRTSPPRPSKSNRKLFWNDCSPQLQPALSCV